jgi:hypothetical protein
VNPIVLEVLHGPVGVRGVEKHIGQKAESGIEVLAEHVDGEIGGVEVGVAVNAGSEIVEGALDFVVRAGLRAADSGGGEEHDSGLVGRALEGAGAELEAYRDLGEVVALDNENFEAVR